MDDKNFDSKKFDQKKYIKDYQKEHYKQFKAKIKNEEMDELNELLDNKNMNKTEFVLNAKLLLERGRMMKISELTKINTLNEKATLLCNARCDENFYDFYFKKPIEWLLENENKINDDYNNNIDKLKFDIILNTNLDDRCNLILSLKNGTVEEFCNYVNFIPYESLKTAEQNKVTKLYDEFKSIDDDYNSIKYFESICRR